MKEITENQYKYALNRVEELLPLVNEYTSPDDRDLIELSIVSDIIIEYETKHYPIQKPTVAELLQLSLEEKGMTQKELAAELGISPSRISEFVSGKSQPSLKIASKICNILNISPAAMLQI